MNYGRRLISRYLWSLISVMVLSVSIRCLTDIHVSLPEVVLIMNQVFLMEVLELILETKISWNLFYSLLCGEPSNGLFYIYISFLRLEERKSFNAILTGKALMLFLVLLMELCSFH